MFVIFFGRGFVVGFQQLVVVVVVRGLVVVFRGFVVIWSVVFVVLWVCGRGCL